MWKKTKHVYADACKQKRYFGPNMDMQKCTFEDAATLVHTQGDEENKLLKDESRHPHKETLSPHKHIREKDA